MTLKFFYHKMTEDEKWMGRCLQLAKCGELGAPPNPMVGAVIVCDGKIVGEGYHARCGEGHAEVSAFASVRNPECLSRSRMYVSLEPCAHYGRTPPCARLIIKKGVKEVVVGMIDPFAKVNGAGVRMLRDAGVKVTTGVLEKECRCLNKKFIIGQTENRPFVTLKWAQSADGLIAPQNKTTSPIFVSTPRTLLHVHHLRALHQAVLVGRHTAQVDNPSLTLRFWPGTQPLRVVLDRRAVLDVSLHLFDGKAPTMVAGEVDSIVRRRWGKYDFLPVDYSLPVLPQLLMALKARGVQSLLVEGGRELLQGFIDQCLWDEAHVELGTQDFHDGVPAPHLPSGCPCSAEAIFGHVCLHYQCRSAE